MLAERDRIAAGMATRVGAVGREVVGRIGTYEIVINDAVRLLADHGFVPPAERDAGPPPAPVVEYGGGADPSGYGTPLMAGYAADPVNTALGNFVEVETDVAFGGLLAGLTFRAHLQLLVGPGGGVRAGLVVVGVDPPGGGHLDRGVRGSGRAAGRVPAHRDGLRAGRRDRRAGGAGGVRAGAGVVRRAALGVRRRGPAGAHLGRPGHRGPVRARRRRPAGRAGPRARASAGPRVGRRPHRGGVRLGRAARRLPLRPGTAGRGGRTGRRAPLRVGRRGPGGVGDRRGRRRGAGQHLRRARAGC